GAAALLRHLSRPDLQLQPRLCGQQRGDAGDRRDDELDRPGDRLDPPRHDPAIGDGDDLVGAQPPDRRPPPDRLRDHRAQRDRRAGPFLAGQGSAMSEGPLLAVNGLGKRFGGFVALENIDLAINPGDRRGLIGPNGSGKSTLVNCLCGTLRNETGTVLFGGRKMEGMIAHQRTRLGLARSFQLPKPFHTLSLNDNIRVPLLYTVNARHGQPHMTDAQIAERCSELLTDVGLADKATRLPRDLTQVEMRKLELARAVATQPRLLFADETMAGLSPSEVEE